MLREPRLMLYARTLAHLQPGQIGHLVLRRLVRPPVMRTRSRAEGERRRAVGLAAIVPDAGTASGATLSFLNVGKSFDPARFDWQSAEMSRLWRYNLHYFDYILGADRAVADSGQLLSSWIAANPRGRGDAWEPYPLSLRVVNWIKLFLRGDFAPHVQREWVHSLHEQAAWLERHLEYHLLANHLLKNGKALLFAGAYLAGADADRWLRKGAGILTAAVSEQLLDDGGHFERSPMYHAIVVEDFLDVLNLLRGSPALAGIMDANMLAGRTRTALEFLADLTYPDGSVAMFNDSVAGVAPPFGTLAQYAGEVMDYDAAKRGPALRTIAYGDSGYYGVAEGQDRLLIDCGEIGPRYQPGHAHCDTLSYELVLAGRPVVVDSGVHDYEDSPMRRYVRSTAAHNTVRIDGCEQSELWGAFRVARRARPLYARIGRRDAAHVLFEGSHDGFTRLPGSPVHVRRIEYRHGCCTVQDRVTGSGTHRAESFIHLHPDLMAVLDGSSVMVTRHDGEPVARIDVLAADQVDVGTSWHCPEFGKRLANAVITLTCEGPLPVTVAYAVHRIANDAAGMVSPA